MAGYGTYDETHMLHGANRDGAIFTEVYLEATGEYFSSDGFIWTIMWPCTVRAFGMRVTTTLNYDTVTTLAVYALVRRPSPGDTSNQVGVCRMTIADGALIGTARFARPRLVESRAACNPGDQLAFRIITPGVGGAAIAGEMEPFVVLIPRAETSANMATPSDWSEDTTTTQV